MGMFLWEFFMLQKRLITQCTMSKEKEENIISISCQLFDKLVKQNLLYGFEIWGNISIDVLEKFIYNIVRCSGF